MTDRQTPKILILDFVGLAPGADGQPDASDVARHVAARNGIFHHGSGRDKPAPEAGKAHFYYMPMLSTEAEILAEARDGFYDAVIAAATFIPAGAQFALGGVRIGAGTGNMGSLSWGGGDGKGGVAPLMNTPGVNARATAQMVMKALLAVRPDLPVAKMNELVSRGHFDTGRDLVRFPTTKLEGQILAVIGYGNIGREVAKLARAFGMVVRIFARAHHRDWIESEGFHWAETPAIAARGANVLSVHLGLGRKGPDGFENAGMIGADVLDAMAPGSVLINYDRGELVDIAALRNALASGRIDHAAIDADLFCAPVTGALSGPMSPYLSLVDKFGDRLSLLPHAAADTDHPTRVAGAKLAVDQILAAIRDQQVHNLRGDLPEGFHQGVAIMPKGLGGLCAGDLAGHVASGRLAHLRACATDLAAAIDRFQSEDAQGMGREVLLACNRLATFLRVSGLEGSFRD